MIAGFFASALLALGVALIDAGAYLLAFPRLPGAMVAPMGWGLAVLIALNLILMGYAKVRALPLPVPQINHRELRSRLRESGDWQRRYPTTTAAGPIRITAPPPAEPAIIHALVVVIGVWGLWGGCR